MEHRRYLFILANILILINACIAIFSSGSSSSTSKLINHIYENEKVVDQLAGIDECSTLAVRFGEAVVVLSLQKFEPTKDYSSSSQLRVISRDNPFILMSSVGNCADCLSSIRWAKDMSRTYNRKNGYSISPSILSAALADEFHRNSMFSNRRQQAIKTLIVGYNELKAVRPSIYRVDCGSNIHRCQAIAVGHLSERFNLWFKNRGIFIANELMRPSNRFKYASWNISSKEVNETATTSTASDDICRCLDIVFHCLKENIDVNRLQFNDTMYSSSDTSKVKLIAEIAVICDHDVIGPAVLKSNIWIDDDDNDSKIDSLGVATDLLTISGVSHHQGKEQEQEKRICMEKKARLPHPLRKWISATR